MRITSGKLIQVNSGAKEHLFFEYDKKNEKWTRTTMTDEEVEDTKWHTWTGVLGEVLCSSQLKFLQVFLTI